MAAEKQAVSSLGLMFDKYEVESPMSSFDAFEEKIGEKQRKWLWLEILLASLLLLLAGLKVSSMISESLSYTTTQNELIISGEQGSISNTNSSTEPNSFANSVSDDETILEQEKHDAMADEASMPSKTVQNPIRIIKAADGGKTPQAVNSFSKDNLLEKIQGISSKTLNWPEFVWTKAGKIHPKNKNFAPVFGAPNPIKDPVAILIQAGLNSTYQQVQKEANADEYVHKDYADILKQGNNAVVKPYFDIGLELPIGLVLNFNTGIGLFQTGNKGSYNYVIDEVPVYDIDGTIAGYLADSSQESISYATNEEYTYVTMPFSMQYKIDLRKIDLYIGLEYRLSYLLNASGQKINENDISSLSNIDGSGLRAMNGAAKFTVGAIKPINRYFGVGVQLNYQQMSFGNSTSAKVNSLSKGYGAGVMFKYNLIRM